MARMPDYLRGRMGTEPLKNKTHNVRIDGVVMGQVRGMPGGRWIWTEHPFTLWDSREEAMAALARDKVERGLVGPEAPAGTRNRAIPAAVRQAVLDRDKGLCQYCLMEGRTTAWSDFDHFIPVAENGPSTIENIQLACKACNQKKGHKHPRNEFGAEWERWAPGKPRP